MQTTALTSTSRVSSQAVRREPSPISPDLDFALRRALMTIESGGALTSNDVPSDTCRDLVTRRQELADCLMPAAPDRIRQILATLADMPAQAETDPTKARFALERDVADLNLIPEWALIAAARAYRRGEIADGKWRPTAGQIAKLARFKCEPAHIQAAQIDRVLAAKSDAAPKVSADRRKELSAMLRGLAASLEHPSERLRLR
jgi:hypothetical protein